MDPQQLPQGWTAQWDAQANRYLYIGESPVPPSTCSFSLVLCSCADPLSW
jgi:hypothetical protein